jgi:hypothetical protein
VPTIFFNGLGAWCLAGKEMISTKFPRRPFCWHVARLAALDVPGFAFVADDAEA